MRLGAVGPATVLAAVLLAGCAIQGPATQTPATQPTATQTPATQTPATRDSLRPTPVPTAGGAPVTSPPSASGSPTTASGPADPRWRFYSSDRHLYASPWYAGRHRIMVPFGCTSAPYYVHDPRCPGREGFHHGIDIAMPCGTPLRSAVRGMVLSPSDPGTPGPAYGVHAFRIRVGNHDILIGHAVTVFVQPGRRVHPGQLIALAADSGAPDGCHLHFEVRAAGGGLATAIDPRTLLALR